MLKNISMATSPWTSHIRAIYEPSTWGPCGNECWNGIDFSWYYSGIHKNEEFTLHIPIGYRYSMAVQPFDVIKVYTHDREPWHLDKIVLESMRFRTPVLTRITTGVYNTWSARPDYRIKYQHSTNITILILMSRFFDTWIDVGVDDCWYHAFTYTYTKPTLGIETLKQGGPCPQIIAHSQ